MTGRARPVEDDAFRLGIEAFERGDASLALQYFLKAERLRPQDARVANALGNTWFSLTHLSKAQGEYARALRLDPKLEAARKNLGILEYRRGQWGEATRNLAIVTRQSAQDAVAWRFLGFSLQAAGKSSHAVEVLRRSLQLDPQDAQTRLALAEVEAQTSSRDAAIADYRSLLRSSALDLSNQRKVGLALLSLNDSQDAADQLAFVSQHSPGDADLELALAQAQAGAQQFDKARQTLQTALQNAKDKSRLEALLGWVEQQDHHPTEAAEAYRDAILADPKWSAPYLELSWLYTEHRHFVEAEKTLREALRFVDDSYPVKVQLGTVLAMGGHEKDAVPVLEDAVAAQPHNPLAYTTLIIAETLLDSSYARPVATAQKALQNCSDDYLVHYLYAGLLLREHRSEFRELGSEKMEERIKSELVKSIQLNPHFPHSHYDLARMEFDLGDFAGAKQEALAALDADKDFSSARYLLGRIYIKEGHRKEGMAEMAAVDKAHRDEIQRIEAVGQSLLASQAARAGSHDPGSSASAVAVSRTEGSEPSKGPQTE
ncbi:MAG: tetratricopeptide repeat protein [Acidobacteriia bacterium]|nr:tetratricopeptide repeat protein [Terriglobia bacterium]